MSPRCPGWARSRSSSTTGVTAETAGIVASAGLIIMMSGTQGHRYIDRHTYVMFHEMQTFKFFSVESVSDQEEQSKINRTIQNSINEFIASKTKLTGEKLSELIKKKELWVNAQGAIEYGFADKITGQASRPGEPSRLPSASPRGERRPGE